MLWLLVVLGVGLRISQWAQDRSLFLDEAFLATNIAQRSVLELLGPLEFDQRAPAGFLVGVKLLTEWFGRSDLALRLLPLISGVVGVLLFHRVARRHLTPRGTLFAMLLFALSPTLVFFSSDLKQYSTDAACALLILWAAPAGATAPITHRRVACLAVAGFVAVWFSFTAVFVLSGVAAVEILSRCRRRQWKHLGALAVAVSFWGVAVVGLYLAQVRHFDADPSWKQLWGGSFMPLPPTSLSDLLWYPQKLGHLVTSPVGLGFGGVGMLVFLAGTLRCWEENRYGTGLLLGPMAVALLASGLRVYPFGGRAIVFLAPLVLLLLAAGVDAMANSLGRRRGLLTATAALLLLFHPAVRLSAHVAKGRPYPNDTFWNYKREETKPAMQFVRDRWQQGDLVYLYSDARVAFGYYADQFGFAEDDYVKGIQSGLMNPSWTEIEKDLEQLRGRRRAWIFFTHVWDLNGVDERLLYLHFLDRMGRRLDGYESPQGCDAWVYLYDLSGNVLGQQGGAAAPNQGASDQQVSSRPARGRERTN